MSNSTQITTARHRSEDTRHTLQAVIFALISLVALAVSIVWGMFGNALLTLRTMERVGDTQLFTMTYRGDYGFDTFLEQGASSDAELVQFIVDQLTNGIPLEFELPDLGCSTFAAQTPEGDAIFARNFDMYYSPALLLETAPDNGYRSISMVNLAYIGYGEDNLPDGLLSSFLTLAAPYAPLDGVNEAGLAVGVLLIDTEPTAQDTGKVDITTTTAIRLLLDRAATVDEAVELLGQYDMHASAGSCYHFQIADAQGNSAVVEYIDNEMSVLPGERAATNFLLTPGDYDFGSGQDRYDIVTDGLEASGGVLDSQQAMELLAACSQAPREDKDSTTQWSCVYDLSHPALDVCIARDYEQVYHFSLS